jgi:hypothetical protein
MRRQTINAAMMLAADWWSTNVAHTTSYIGVAQALFVHLSGILSFFTLRLGATN